MYIDWKHIFNKELVHSANNHLKRAIRVKYDLTVNIEAYTINDINEIFIYNII